MINNLLNNVKITRILVDTAAGQAATASDILDMQGFHGVLFIAKLGDVTNGSVVTLQAQQNTVNSATGMANLTGTVTKTSAADTDCDDGLLILDVVEPRERYVRAVLTSATQNAVKNGIIAIQYGAAAVPIVQGTTVLDSDTIHDPAEV
jgi:hypothetical protein